MTARRAHFRALASHKRDALAPSCLRVRVVAALVALLLAGCSLPIETEHFVSVRNRGAEPVTVQVRIVALDEGRVVFERPFTVAAGGQEEAADRFPFGTDLLVTATTADLSASRTVQVHSGSWWIGVHVREGEIAIAVLHGD